MSVLVACLACLQKAEDPQKEVIDGVMHVHNPAFPLQGEKTVTFEEELAIAAERAGGEVLLYEPSLFTVDGSENIYISDQANNVISVFDPEGRLLRQFGSKGEGPGEFLFIGSLAPLSDGKFLVADFQGRRVSVFAEDGVLVSGHQFLNRPSSILMTSGAGYTLLERSFDEEEHIHVKRYDFAGDEILYYGEFYPHPLSSTRIGGSLYYTPLPFAPESIFAGDPGRQWVYHCYTKEYVIEVYDTSGSVIRRIDRAYTPVTVSETDRRDFVSRFENSLPEIAASVREIKVPGSKPVATGMIVDDKGNLWVRTYETRTDGGREQTAYDIFDAEGLYQIRAWSERHPRLFVLGRAYFLDEDDDSGIRTLKKFRVVWGSREDPI
jgi:hypothetical protein